MRLTPPAFAALAAALLAAPPAVAQQGPPSVTVDRPAQREITEWQEFTGRFEAVERVEIRARVAGYLQRVAFVDGARVEAGDLLYVIDPAPFEAEVERAEAALARARSAAELARLELARREELFDRNAVAISREEVDIRRANLDGAIADVAAAEATLRRARLDLEYTEIRAPVAGRVSATNVDVGNLVESGGGGSTLLTTLVSTDPIHFLFDVNERDYLRLRRMRGVERLPTRDNPLGPAQVRLLDETEWTREGVIDFVDNSFDVGAGTLRVRARFDNPDELLSPNLFGRLRLPAKGPYQALMIDPAAVLSDQASKLVMTVDADNVVVPRPVVLGPVIDGLQVVREGLGPDDRVIVSGLMRARPGQKVEPAAAEPGRVAGAGG